MIGSHVMLKRHQSEKMADEKKFNIAQINK